MDHIKDTNRSVLYRIAAETIIPRFVQETELMQEKEASELASAAFADPFMREYPIHTRGDTWLSLAYFKRTGSGNLMTKEALDQACTFWRLSEAEIRSALDAPVEKVASMGLPIRVIDQSGALVWQTEIRDRSDFEKLATDIVEHPADYSYPARRQLATQLLKLGAEEDWTFSPDFSTTLHKYAGLFAVHKDSLLSELERRRLGLQTNQEEFRARLFKLAAEVKTTKPELVDAPLFEKCAGITDIIDSFVDRHRFNTPLELCVSSVPANLFRKFQKTAVAVGNEFASLSGVKNKMKDIKGYLVSTGTVKEAAEDSEVIASLGNLPTARATFVMSLIGG
jgi:hypothetical protein